MPVLARTDAGKNGKTTVSRDVRKLLELNDSDPIGRVYGEGRAYVRDWWVIAWPGY